MFGNSKTDKNQDRLLSNLNKNQAVLIKNNEWFIKQIYRLIDENKTQTSFDNKVSKTLTDINVKLADYLSMAKEVKGLQSQVAALQANAHKHEAVTE